MNKMVKLLTVAMVFSMMATGIVGCSGAVEKSSAASSSKSTESTSEKTTPGVKVKISVAYNWMGQDSKAPGWEGRLNEFKGEYKNQVDLEMIPVAGGGTGIRTKIQTDFAANNAADFIVFYDGNEILPYVRSNYLADLTDIINKDADLKDRFVAGSMDGTTFDGKIYGIPMSQCYVGLYANSKLFKKYNLEYPKTYADLKNCITVFKSNGIIPIALGNKSNGYAHLLYSAFVQRFIKPGEASSAGNSKGASYLDTGFIKAAEVIMEMTKLGAFPEGVNGIDAFQSIEMFSNEKAAMIFSGSWGIGSMKAEMFPNIEPILLPTFTGETVEPNSICGFTEMSLLVNANMQKDPARKAFISTFIKYVSDPVFVKKFAESTGSVIPSVNGVKLGSEATNVVLIKTVDLFNNVKARGPRVTTYLTPGQTAVLRDAVANMLNGIQTPTQNMKMVQDKINEDLKTK